MENGFEFSVLSQINGIGMSMLRMTIMYIFVITEIMINSVRINSFIYSSIFSYYYRSKYWMEYIHISIY